MNEQPTTHARRFDPPRNEIEEHAPFTGDERKLVRVRAMKEIAFARENPDDPCSKKAEVQWVLPNAIAAFSSGTLALNVDPGLSLSVDEEGRWRCAFDYQLGHFFVWAAFTLRFRFRSVCRTELAWLDGWQFVGGPLPLTSTQLPWQSTAGHASAIRVPWQEFFPLILANTPDTHTEVRSGVSHRLRHDFARLHFLRCEIDGLFQLVSL